MSQSEPPIDEVEVEQVSGAGETSIEFPADRVTDACIVSRLGDRLYRLEGVLLSELAAFRDVIEAEPVSESKIRFVRVAKASGWRSYSFVLPRDYLDSAKGRSVLQRVEAAGGYWERLFSGVLVICMPPQSAVDPVPWVLGSRPPGLRHNSPKQRTGAAGIVSVVRKLLGGGSGR